jgi:hypothetical protein
MYDAARAALIGERQTRGRFAMSGLDPSIKPELSPRHSSDLNLGVIVLATLAALAIAFALTFPEFMAHSRRWTPALYWEPIDAFLAAPSRNWC